MPREIHPRVTPQRKMSRHTAARPPKDPFSRKPFGLRFFGKDKILFAPLIRQSQSEETPHWCNEGLPRPK
jgi:hypothetical protein